MRKRESRGLAAIRSHYAGHAVTRLEHWPAAAPPAVHATPACCLEGESRSGSRGSPPCPMTNRCPRIYVGTGPVDCVHGATAPAHRPPRNQVPGVYQIYEVWALSSSVIGWPGEGCTPKCFASHAVQREVGILITRA